MKLLSDYAKRITDPVFDICGDTSLTAGQTLTVLKLATETIDIEIARWEETIERQTEVSDRDPLDATPGPAHRLDAWAWAVVDPNGRQRNRAGDRVDYLVYFDRESAQSGLDDAIDKCEEGDPEPTIVPLVPRDDSIFVTVKEAADSIHASLAEDGISDDRKRYRVDLERRLRAIIPAPPPSVPPEPAWRPGLGNSRPVPPAGETGSGRGKALPDAEGLWFRNERQHLEWVEVGRRSDGTLAGEAWSLKPKCRATLGWLDLDELDRGGWQAGGEGERLNDAKIEAMNAGAVLICGHPASLNVKSIESDHSYCELCETKDRLRDSMEMERYNRERAEASAAALATVEAERDKLSRFLEQDAQDQAATDSAIRKLATPILGEAYVKGDTHFVPPIEDLVQKVCEKFTESALAEARGEIERLKHRLTSYEAIETRAEQLLDPTFRWQHCEALFDLVDEFGKLRERLAAVEAAGKLAMEAMQDNLSAYCYKNEPALLSAYRAMEAALTTAATRPSPRCKPMPNDVTELKARVRELEQALRDLIAACKTSGRIVGYNSDAVDRAEAVLRAKGE